VRTALREGTTPIQLRMLRAGATDLAVVARTESTSDDPQLVVDSLMEDPLLLAVSREHPLAAERSVEVDDLASYPWIIGKNEVGDPQLDLWRRVEWQPQTRFTVKDWTAKLGLIASGLGVGLVPGLAAVSVRDDVALLALRAAGRPTVTRSVVLATRPGTRELPHVRAISELMYYAAAELARELEARLQDRRW
jgi:DNA-binding transcriptional LysR family regulator